MSELESKSAEMLDKIEAISEAYAPEIFDAAIAAVKITAIENIVNALVFILLFTVICIVCFKGLQKIYEKMTANPESDWELIFLLGCALTVPTLVGMLVNFYELIQLWNWVAIFNPELGLAQKIMGL